MENQRQLILVNLKCIKQVFDKILGLCRKLFEYSQRHVVMSLNILDFLEINIYTFYYNVMPKSVSNR